jgi:hypothetical protein
MRHPKNFFPQLIFILLPPYPMEEAPPHFAEGSGLPPGPQETLKIRPRII